jgi:hypothetical protein
VNSGDRRSLRRGLNPSVFDERIQLSPVKSSRHVTFIDRTQDAIRKSGFSIFIIKRVYFVSQEVLLSGVSSPQSSVRIIIATVETIT